MVYGVEGVFEFATVEIWRWRRYGVWGLLRGVVISPSANSFAIAKLEVVVVSLELCEGAGDGVEVVVDG